MDFVTFEIAKKLKEKGFKEKVIKYYGKHENMFDCHPPLDMNDCGYRCSAPTISQVLKWLREKHLLVIPVPSYFNAEGVCVSWDCDIWADDNYEYFPKYMNKETYEKAALAGIEYVLDNLI